jgi:hypothetical protein
VAAWTGVASVGYALTLTVATDHLYLFAIPGMLCLVTVVAVAVLRVQRAPVRVTDARDVRAVLRRHRAVVGWRYGTLLALAVASCSVPLLLDVAVLYPLVGVGLVTAILLHSVVAAQVCLLRHCSRVLAGYEPRSASVHVILALDRGRLCVRVGRSPRMVARGVARLGPESSGDGRFAGDDELGGVLVTASGDLALLVPQDGAERARHRSRADAERKDRERRAGLDRLHP